MVEWANLQTFLGWCSVINIAFLMFTSLFLVLMGETVVGLHAKLFHLEKSAIRESYFKYLANYKVVTLIFNVVPYFAIRLMSQ